MNLKLLKTIKAAKASIRKAYNPIDPLPTPKKQSDRLVLLRNGGKWEQFNSKQEVVDFLTNELINGYHPSSDGKIEVQDGLNDFIKLSPQEAVESMLKDGELEVWSECFVGRGDDHAFLSLLEIN